MNSLALYVAIIRLIPSIEAIEAALSVFKEGTISFAKFSWRMRHVAGQNDKIRISQMDHQRLVPGVCPGVETRVTLPSPNTSVSPFSSLRYSAHP